MASKKTKIEINTNKDLQNAFEMLTRKRPIYDELYQYYRGNHPLRYSTERLSKAFDKIGTYFAQNWLAVIVDAVLDRLVLKGFDITNEAADEMIDGIWEDNHMSLLADDVHEASVVCGESYVIAWREEDDEKGDITDVYFNDPRMCHVFYDPYRPTEKLYAAKLWIGKDYKPRMMLYYPDHLEHYISQSMVADRNAWIGSAGGFQADPEYGTPEEPGMEPNEYGIIPVFHFRTGRISGKREIGKSEVALQDAVNKLFADMMVASEFTTFTQRVIISQADPGNLKNQPGNNWWLPAGDGKGQSANVLEIGGKALSPYLEAIDKLAQSMAIISRTPKHYLMLAGGDPSGDALLAMESPLNKKVQKRQEGYSVEWQALAQFLLKLQGTEIDVSEITPIWEPIETVQPLASAQIVQTETSAGVPLVTSVRRRGWDKADIAQMEEDKKAEDKRKSGLAQDALDKLRAEDAANNVGPDGMPMTNVPPGLAAAQAARKATQ